MRLDIIDMIVFVSEVWMFFPIDFQNLLLSKTLITSVTNFFSLLRNLVV